MKTAVSIPDPLFAEAEAEARKLGLSRSKLVQIALEDWLKARRDAELTAAINRAVERDGEPTPEDEAWLAHGREMLRRVQWDE